MKLTFCILTFIALMTLAISTLVIILKASEHIAKGPLAAILGVTTLISGIMIVYTIVSCARFTECSPFILLILATIIQSLVCSLLIYAIKQVEKKHEVLNKIDPPVALAATAKPPPHCPKVSTLQKPSTEFMQCLNAGYVYVDGACAAPQEYGVAKGSDFKKLCAISCGQNYVFQEKPMC